MDSLEEKRNLLKTKVRKLFPAPGLLQTGIKGFGAALRTAPTFNRHCFYKPTAIVVLQGKKQTVLGSEKFTYNENQLVVTSIDIPTVGSIVEASPEKPFMTLILDLDSYLISQLLSEGNYPHNETARRGMGIAETDEALLDAFYRLISLLDRPERQKIMAPMIIKEIHYLLLTSPLGDILRSVNTKGSRNNQIADAIAWLKENYRQPLKIEELAHKFDESFVQPLDNNDNTGEKNELASLIGNFNPTWDAEGSNDEAFFQAVSVAGMILENKFDRYRGNERADKRVEEIYERHMQAFHDREKHSEDAKILILPEFVPCQKFLSETPVAFVIFPSNRGGYCIQPQKKEYSMNYKCSFPSEWLGLENEELQEVTGLKTAGFCHKGGFLMTTGELADAVQACKISMEQFREKPVIVSFGGDTEYDELLHQIPKLQAAEIIHIDIQPLPEVEIQGIYAEVSMEKQEWKARIKEQVKQILKYKPEAVFVGENLFVAYPIVHALRKKHIPVLVPAEKDGQKLLIRIPSGS